MFTRKPVLIFGLILAIVAALTSQVKASLNEWESATDAESMNPDMAYAFSGNYMQTAGQYDRNADGRVDLIIADRNGDGRAVDNGVVDRDELYGERAHLEPVPRRHLPEVRFLARQALLQPVLYETEREPRGEDRRRYLL